MNINFKESTKSYTSHYSFLTDKYSVVLHGFSPLNEGDSEDSVKRKDDGKLTTYTSSNLEELVTESIKLSNRFSLLNSDLLADYDLKARVIDLQYSHSLNAPYETASFTLEMSLPEMLRGLHGTPINVFYQNTGTLVSRFVRTGGWISIRQNERLVFFGNIESFSSALSFSGEIPVQSIQVSCLSWLNNLVESEIRQTSQTKEGKLSEISPSAIIKSNEFKEGFLKALQKNINLAGGGNEPSDMLKDLIKALAHHKLPKSLSGGSINTRLGDLVEVYDGTPVSLENTQYYPFSSPSDKVRGNLLAKYQSFTSTGMSHWELINQIFFGFPTLLELFPFIIPLSASDKPKNALESALNGRLGVMYRYKPVNPTYPPTQAGLSKLLKRRTGYTKKGLKTQSEEFFDTFREDVSYFELEVKTITNFSYTYTEQEHLNCVFVEAPFVNGDAHNSNLFRSNASPVMNIGDVNRHGLKILSSTNPFTSNSEDKADIKQFNQISSNALAERAFHSIAMGHEFCSGSVQTSIPYTEEFISPSAGMWIKLKLGGIGEETEFTAYVESVDTSIFNQGDILVKEITYSFSRGSFGNNVISFEPLQFQIEKPEVLRKTNTRIEQEQ